MLSTIVIGSVAVAACGGDDDAADDPQPVASEPAATSTPGDEAAAPTTAAVVSTTDAAAPTTQVASTASQPSGTAAGDAEWDAIVAAGTDEGKVVSYTAHQPDQEARFADCFKAEYPGIDVEIVRDVPANLIPKVEAERQTGQAIGDVLVGPGDLYWQEQVDGGKLIPFVGPAFADIPADLLHEGLAFEPSGAVLGFGWNTDLAPDGFASREEMLDPANAGLIGIPEAASDAVVDFYIYMEEEYGEDYLTALAELEPRIYPSGAAIREALIAGEIATTIYMGAAPSLQADGAPIDWVVPEGSWGAHYFGGILDSAPHPNAAQLYVNFMMTPEGQECLTQELAPLALEVPGGGPLLSTVRRSPVWDADTLTEYREKWDSLFR